MRIAIGSTKEAKVDAVKEAWEIFGSRLLELPDDPVTFLSYDVQKEGPEMALDTAQLMRGALSRVEFLALQLKRERSETDFYIGLEGGFNVVGHAGRRQVFLESWAYVSDGHESYYGHSGGIVVPPRIADPVIDRGIELSIILDRFDQRSQARSGEGAWGLLTCDILSWKHSFVIALIAAFAPFYNRAIYKP